MMLCPLFRLVWAAWIYSLVVLAVGKQVVSLAHCLMARLALWGGLPNSSCSTALQRRCCLCGLSVVALFLATIMVGQQIWGLAMFVMW
jgi:hypothetical protein